MQVQVRLEGAPGKSRCAHGHASSRTCKPAHSFRAWHTTALATERANRRYERAGPAFAMGNGKLKRRHRPTRETGHVQCAWPRGRGGAQGGQGHA